MNAKRSITADEDAGRLDRFLADHLSDFTRSRVRQLISGGHVTLDGAVAKPSSRVKAGQHVEVTVPEPATSRLTPQDIPVNVVYQDRDLLVVDKPAGLTVHPAPGHPDRTLVNALLSICPDLQEIGGTVRPGLVHRLDKDTSGLMVVAKNDKAHTDLAEQLKERRFTKVYTALVEGRLSPSEAVIEAPIGRDPRNRKRMAVVARGREAATRYRVLRYYRDFTLAEVRPSTGRTHQVRVHFASISRPLAGDGIYGSSDPALGRHFLHSRLLGFRHPSTGEHVEFTCELPSELGRFLERLSEPEAPRAQRSRRATTA